MVDTQLPATLSGMYRGKFIARGSSENAQIIMSGVVDNPISYKTDNNIVWICNSEFEEIYRIIPTHITYNTDMISGDITSTIGIQAKRSGISDTLPVSVAPISVSYTHLRAHET